MVNYGKEFTLQIVSYQEFYLEVKIIGESTPMTITRFYPKVFGPS
jgi:hypothetical protein